MTDFVDILVDMVILILSAVVGFGIYYSVNGTDLGWDATVVTIWNYIPLVFIFVGIIGLIVKVKYIGH